MWSALFLKPRPEIVPQIAALALKSGNSVILKGEPEAVQSNQVLFSIWREALRHNPRHPLEVINLLYTRDDVSEMLSWPTISIDHSRGSQEFVEARCRT